MLGIRVELDEAEAVLDELQRLIREIRQAGVEQPEKYLYYTSLQACALPLKCQYVTLIGEWEHPWMEAVLEINNFLGVFLLSNASRKKTIETLVDREYLSVLSNADAKRIVPRLIHAFSRNLDEIEDREGEPGGILAQILGNVPELLIRFMTRCPEENQGEALRMLKALMEKEALPVSFPMALLCMGITQQVSERIKAQMLDEMLQTAIVEHKTLHGHGDGMNLFAFYI